MTYPPKPWSDQQVFVYNGVTYVYDAATNSWRYNDVTLHRLCPAVVLTTPGADATLELEFGKDQNFNSIVKSYFSVDSSVHGRMWLMQSTGSFINVPASGIIKAQFKQLHLLPEVDLSLRYFIRYRWSVNGTYTTYDGMLYP